MHDLSVTETADLVGIEHGANPLLEDNHVGGFDSDVGSAVLDLLTPDDLEEDRQPVATKRSKDC